MAEDITRETNSRIVRYGWLIALSGISFLTLAIYSATFASPFSFDDFMYITENPFIRDLSNFWPPSGTRYAGYLSFALNYSYGGLDVTGFHIVNVIVTYLRLLLLPVNQNFDYEYPVFDSLFRAQVLASFVFLLALFIFAVYLLRRHYANRSAYPLAIATGIFWFFITISVESSIIPIQHVIFEHRLYLPSAGAALAFAAGLFYVIDLIRPNVSAWAIVAAAAILAVAPLSVASFLRNQLWKDPVALYADLVRKSPNKLPGRVFLGHAYLQKGDADRAIGELTAALRIEANDPTAHFFLGNAWKEKGFIEKAAKEYAEAVQLKPDHYEARNNLATAYFILGRFDEALAEYILVLEYRPGHAEAHYNLSLLYEKIGQDREAHEHYQKYLELSGGQGR
ncbi:MAG TPA: hypothetical protein DDW94_01675 [Deltaproteobacteria bacterium]|nr:MAG: hypothetical protein A2Z79_07715 [Deltaproteobacteria bacterium GWA2_55_82]OGQ65118.1 MAG: hypothetical protein A3I81_07135 [Deltaproteobacteria bacterium RIFCSPLOWO2_02_FULL_55_12]OIJ74756.1 MAG: hypothetical protein A2V21_311070 [Deltaproteobacteria bacterium GWC2_55_46]HBG45683.1 hypothetical protein [Deltaproteobacteria bacterium]HCY12124.1 hypothetical protein [Deltaproteobacteria bacterium]